jgi:hypothetical protein
MKHDSNLDTLLELDGVTFGLEVHGCWVKFEAHKVERTDAKPHGIDYSLTLHSKDGARIFGMDNAHRAMDGKENYKARVVTYDHLHPDGKKRSHPYKFKTADKLMVDFWKRVDKRIDELYG